MGQFWPAPKHNPAKSVRHCKGIGGITLLDDDLVEPSNLNRQRFHINDVGENKALALARNLVPECIAETEITGIPLRLEDAIACDIDLDCDVAICGVDNNPARVAANRFFRARRIRCITLDKARGQSPLAGDDLRRILPTATASTAGRIDSMMVPGS